jgi:carbon-monoxide dehydrogenase medium subunit
VKPPPFAYAAPESEDEALALLAAHGDDAKLLAGGQSLIPLLNFRLARPSLLIDLNRVAGLAGIAAGDRGAVRVGAMTRQRDAERSRVLAERAPLVVEALPHVAHPQIRNRGTVGGSLAHADPAAELPAVMVALGVRYRLRSRLRERWVAAEEFTTGILATSLGSDELLAEVELPPLPTGAGWAFEEVARRHGDYALLGVAAVVAVDDAGACRHARLVYVNAGGGPVRGRGAEAALLGERPDPKAIRAAAAAAAEDVDPVTDVHASAAYRRHLATVLTGRALERAFARAGRADTAGAGASRPLSH